MNFLSADTLGRLAGLHSGWPPWLVSTYRYDLLGRVVEIESPVEMDGLARTTRYEYEGASLKRVCELSGQTSCAEPGAQSYLEDVSYDALGRRTQLSLPGGDRTFAYDATTQRITRAISRPLAVPHTTRSEIFWRFRGRLAFRVTPPSRPPTATTPATA